MSALNRGDKVIATARSLKKLDAELAAVDLSDAQRANLRTLELDITEGLESLKEKVNRAATFFGRIDVLVNNAGAPNSCLSFLQNCSTSLGQAYGGLVEEGRFVLSISFLE